MRISILPNVRRLLFILLLCGSSWAQVYTDVAPHSMTSNSVPSPFTASASGFYNGTYFPYRAFNAANIGPGDGWINNVTGSCWIQIDFGFAYTVYKYTIDPHEAARAPKTWTLAGSNDNFSTHTDLDTQTNNTSWVSSTPQTFTISSPGSYRYYRITSAVNNGDPTFTAISQLYFYTIESSWGKSYLPGPVQTCNINSGICAFTNNVTSGNIIFVGAHREATLSTPTDTRSTTWTLVDSSVASSVAMDSYLWCGVLGSSGAETVTVTSADGTMAMEYPATAGFTCTKDASRNGVSGGSTPYAPSISTSSNGDLLVCYMAALNSSDLPIPHEGGAFVSTGAQNGADSAGLSYRYGALAGSEFCAFDEINNSGGGLQTPYIFASFQPSAITILTTALPTGSTTNSYSYTLQAVGGAGAYTWSISSGALPSGLSISSAGVITGTPTGGTQTPTFQVTDGTHTTTKSLTLTVNSSAGTMSIVSSVSIGSGSSTGSLGTVTSGNCVVAAVHMSGPRPINALTDSLSTAFKFAGLHYSPTSPIGWTLWYGVATSTGTDTLTTIANHSGTLAVQIANCQGFAEVSAGNAGINGGSVTLSGTALTTLAPGSEIWSAVVASVAGTTWTAGTGFSTSGDASLSNCCQGINATESSVGTYTPSFVQSGNANGNWVIWGIALRPSTSGVVNTNHRRAWVIER